jgi:hypothetical protein
LLAQPGKFSVNQRLLHLLDARTSA